MQITLNRSGDWRRVATVEVSSRVRNLPTLLQDDSIKFRLVETGSPERRVRRYDVLVDSMEGECRHARTAWAVLSALRETARHGGINQYRVVEGDHGLSRFDALAAPGPETHAARWA